MARRRRNTKQESSIVASTPTLEPFEEQEVYFSREEYLDLKKTLVASEQQAYQDFDKAMLTLAGSAFGLSLTFVQVFSPKPKEAIFLFGAWACFIVSLLCTLYSYISSQHAFRKQQKLLDELYLGINHDGKSQRNWGDNITAFLNYLSPFVFIVGVVLFAVFAYRNLPQ